MLLSKILENLDYNCSDFKDCEIEDIVYSSGKAHENTVFVAMPGAYADGHDYAESAYLKGTRVFILEKKLPLPSDALCLYVKDSRAALAVISGNFFSHPDRELDVIGVTGTKGKTTVTHMISTCLNFCGIKSGVIGTVGAYYEDKYIPTLNTTPESYETDKLLRLMADAGCKAVCMEVSSLGLKSHRVDGIHFSTAVFTNLSPDHIGGAEHASFEEYAYWKKQLFKKCDKVLLNNDDVFSEEIRKEINVPVKSFAVDGDADITADNIKAIREAGFFGVQFGCSTEKGHFPVKVAMPGIFSVYNALAAIGVCLFYGTETDKIAAAIEQARVRGRNELIKVPADYDVIIDYAHNGQSFSSIFDTVKEYPHNHIITVFGSVGGRAQLRRQEMGIISGKNSDLSVITADDPNFEDPQDIAEEIARYVKKAGGEYKIITDRKKAVAYALSVAKPHDIVLILGKGHETYQRVKGEKIHYSDHESVAEYFEENK